MIDGSLQIGPHSLVYGASSFEALNSDASLLESGGYNSQKTPIIGLPTVDTSTQ